MSKNSERICICFRPVELEVFNELCIKKRYFRSTFIREMVMFCVDNDFSPIDLWKMFREYNDLRKYAADNKGKDIDGKKALHKSMD